MYIIIQYQKEYIPLLKSLTCCLPAYFSSSLCFHLSTYRRLQLTTLLSSISLNMFGKFTNIIT